MGGKFRDDTVVTLELACLRQVAVSEAGELKEELKTLKAEYQACQSRYEDERGRLENDVTTLGGKLAALEKMCQTESVEKAKLEKELRKVGINVHVFMKL